MTASVPSGALWAGASIVAFLVGLVAAVLLVGFLENSLGLARDVALATWPITWGIVAIAGVALGANLVFAIGPRISARRLLVPAVGLALAAALQVALSRWAVARFGALDVDAVGPTAALFAVLVALATSRFGVAIAPAGAVAWPGVGVLAAAIAAILIGLANVGGLRDGIGEQGVLLGAVVTGATGYAIACAVVAVRAIGGATSRPPARPPRNPSDPVGVSRLADRRAEELGRGRPDVALGDRERDTPRLRPEG